MECSGMRKPSGFRSAHPDSIASTWCYDKLHGGVFDKQGTDMKNGTFTLACVAILFLSAPSSLAQQRQPIDTIRAQNDMNERIKQATEKYAREIGISENYFWYGQGELHLKTCAHPNNGFIPFGINYSRITDQKELDRVIWARENDEKIVHNFVPSECKKVLTDAR